MAIGGPDNLQEECSYGSNNWTFNSRPGLTEIQGRPTKWNWNTPNVRGGNEVPIFCDTMWKGGGPYESGIGAQPPQFDGQWLGINYEMLHFCINRHDGFINATFLDWLLRTTTVMVCNRNVHLYSPKSNTKILAQWSAAAIESVRAKLAFSGQKQG
jgi:hypothetical protein